ncbi:hypothetical protein A7E75_01375 [Syntrophotalea acetylenica]|uniref:Uncharacterized protein n=1 Tax=Syntrophotalea acetylenica TaxID=29542 RepID=A0A1L3GCZ3_SYNAC|nr:hypothetical protein A7E75_01375 [Syntrophotalea acetylenica]APG44404.1 hypothetical protein A6070_09990 [Syntrophotalea acetylenica]
MIRISYTADLHFGYGFHAWQEPATGRCDDQPAGRLLRRVGSRKAGHAGIERRRPEAVLRAIRIRLQSSHGDAL